MEATPLFARIKRRWARLRYQWETRPALQLENRAQQAVQAQAGPDPIRVTDVLARYTPQEHVARANAYFVREAEDEIMFRRPFFHPGETQGRMAGLAIVMQQLELFDGARVLDFGCGTGWLSRSLGRMCLDVVGVDVSDNALTLGRKFLARESLATPMQVEFRLFDSFRLPLEDASVDRIVCYDAFHHVLDQAGTLREMARVLRPGGIAAFHEPGPAHSQTPTAQSEMRDHDVIENDIDVRRIWQMAEAAGFAAIWIALPALHAPIIGLDQLDRITAGRPSHDDVERIVQNTYNFSYNLRIFSLHKPGATAA